MAVEAAIAAARKFAQRDNIGPVEIKADTTHVSKKDRGAEEAALARIKKLVRKYFPDASLEINSEEIGEITSTDDNDDKKKNTIRILMDPLDGSQPYIRGENTTAFGISIEVDGKVVATCLYQPFMNRMVLTDSNGIVKCFSFTDQSFLNAKEVSFENRKDQDDFFDANIAIDALFAHGSNAHRKTKLLELITAEADKDKPEGAKFGKVTFKMDGANIGSQLSLLFNEERDAVVTDAVGGPWDVKIGAEAVRSHGGQATGLFPDEIGVCQVWVFTRRGVDAIHSRLVELVKLSYGDEYQGFSKPDIEKDNSGTRYDFTSYAMFHFT